MLKLLLVLRQLRGLFYRDASMDIHPKLKFVRLREQITLEDDFFDDLLGLETSGVVFWN